MRFHPRTSLSTADFNVLSRCCQYESSLVNLTCLAKIETDTASWALAFTSACAWATASGTLVHDTGIVKLAFGPGSSEKIWLMNPVSHGNFNEVHSTDDKNALETALFVSELEADGPGGMQSDADSQGDLSGSDRGFSPVESKQPSRILSISSSPTNECSLTGAPRLWELPRSCHLWRNPLSCLSDESSSMAQIPPCRVVFHKERHVIKVIDYSHTPHEVACMMFPSQAFQKLEPNFIHCFLAQENSVLAIQVLCKAQHASLET